MEPVPEKSWNDLIITVPFSLAANAIRLDICFGASISTSTYLAPETAALISRSSQIPAAAASVSEGSASISEAILQVATSGTSEEKHSCISAADIGQLSSRISAISQPESSRMASSADLLCIVVQIISNSKHLTFLSPYRQTTERFRHSRYHGSGQSRFSRFPPSCP